MAIVERSVILAVLYIVIIRSCSDISRQLCSSVLWGRLLPRRFALCLSSSWRSLLSNFSSVSARFTLFIDFLKLSFSRLINFKRFTDDHWAILLKDIGAWLKIIFQDFFYVVCNIPLDRISFSFWPANTIADFLRILYQKLSWALIDSIRPSLSNSSIIVSRLLSRSRYWNLAQIFRCHF